MPFYELMMVLRPMPKKEVVDCLKRAANIVWKGSGVINKIEYLGFNRLPWSAKGENEGEKTREGSYFLYHISMNNRDIKFLKPEFKLEVDIINYSASLSDDSKISPDYECTLHEELQPPAYRKSVQPLLDEKNVRTDRRDYVTDV